MVSAAVAHLPTAVSLLLLAALFMQILGVSLALTWPHRLCLLRVLLCGSLCFPLSKHTGKGDAASALSGLHVCLQFMWEVGLPPLLWSFPPTTTFTRFPAPDYWAVVLLLPAAMFFYSSLGSGSSLLSCVFLPQQLSQAFPLLVAGCALPLPTEPLWTIGLVYLQFREGFPSPNLRRSVRPTLFPACLYCSYCLLLSFSFFPGWRLVCPGGYAVLAQACLWENRLPGSSPGPRLPKLSGRQRVAARGPPGFSV
jgi:hypothetical protein